MGVTWEALRARRDELVAAEAAAKGKRQLARMHARHGVTPDAQCGGCAHLFDHKGDFAGHYFKCHEYGVTAGAGSDWRLKWPACGLFTARAAPA